MNRRCFFDYLFNKLTSIDNSTPLKLFKNYLINTRKNKQKFWSIPKIRSKTTAKTCYTIKFDGIKSCSKLYQKHYDDDVVAFYIKRKTYFTALKKRQVINAPLDLNKVRWHCAMRSNKNFSVSVGKYCSISTNVKNIEYCSSKILETT